MAFEFGECSPEEYKYGMPERVKEEDLEVCSYYTWMLALTNGPYKVPALIEEVVLQDDTSGLYRVENLIVDGNGNPLGEARNHLFHDGFYMREDPHDLKRLGEFAFSFREGHENIYTGYFRDDYDCDPPPPYPGEEVGVEQEDLAELAKAMAIALR